MYISAIGTCCNLRSVYVNTGSNMGVERADSPERITFSKINKSIIGENNIFELIAEWKNFCQKQIINGKSDFIA